MIRTIDIRLNAAHPELPLPEATTYQNAPSTAFLRGVPKSCGLWQITAVSVAATYPDGLTTTRAAVLSAGDVWVATIPACATSGRTASGLRILADGIDENGDAVTGYVLGVADLAVATFDIAPAPGETSYTLRYFDNVPNPPHKGDVAKVGGTLKYYDGASWQVFADINLRNYATKADATLAERTGQDDYWQFGPLTTTDTDYIWVYETPEYSNGVWTTMITNGPDFATLTANGGADATYLEFATASGATPTASGVAWRSANGYRLGSQADMPLASEAEAEALRTAVAGKLDKIGGTMTGPLILNGDNIGVSVTDGTITTAIGKDVIAHTEQTSSQTFRTVTNTLPSKDGPLAAAADLPSSETWTFEADDGQGGTTTITKNVAVYAAGGNA